MGCGACGQEHDCLSYKRVLISSGATSPSYPKGHLQVPLVFPSYQMHAARGYEGLIPRLIPQKKNIAISFLDLNMIPQRHRLSSGNISREVEIKFETKSTFWNLIRTDFSANSFILKPNQMTNPKTAVRAE